MNNSNDDPNWRGVCIVTLWGEFTTWDDSGEIGPGINWLIEQGYTVNNGRSPFHVRVLREEFTNAMTHRHIARLSP